MITNTVLAVNAVARHTSSHVIIPAWAGIAIIAVGVVAIGFAAWKVLTYNK